MTADELLGRLLIDIAIVIAVGRLFGLLLRRLRQPSVLGEIIAGIALGPTLLGSLPGDPSAALFPEEVRAGLTAIGGIGLVLFMFLVGLEFDLRGARRLRRAVLAVSTGSIVVPFALGILLAGVLHGRHGVVDGAAVPFAPFALFIATALSITAFPVLARILADRGWQGTRLGALATASAAAQDAVGWVLLAVALVVLRADGSLPLIRMLLESAAFVLVLVAIVRPLLRTSSIRLGSVEATAGHAIAAVVFGLIASAAATRLIGLHAALGAFCFGAIFPRQENPKLAAAVRQSIQPVTMAALLPVFFVTPGLSVDLSGLDGGGVAEMALILGVACAGKLIGAALGARAAGLRGREVGQLAALMNTRGLIELIVLNVGLTAGLLDVRLFSELVVVAIVTTLMAGPLLDLIEARSPKRPRERSGAALEAPSSEPTVA